jgi:hypothetical protein
VDEIEAHTYVPFPTIVLSLSLVPVSEKDLTHRNWSEVKAVHYFKKVVCGERNFDSYC